ncbi:MAG: PAS domain S-box protein [Candidatus Lokiarchaeota archaeon]|nr:PAS domain S-box protein [Candidatus Lokiarchaeota archaeon]
MNIIGGIVVSDSSILNEISDSFLENLENISNFVPNAIFTIDKDCNITTCNKKFLELTGYDIKELIGKKCNFFTCNEYKETCSFLSKYKEKPVYGELCTITKKNGEILYVKKSIDHLKDSKGNIMGGIETFEDITDLITLNHQLKESEVKLNLLNESSNELFIIFDDQFKFKYINENACFKITGYHADALLDKIINLFIHPDDLKEFFKLHDIVLKEGETKAKFRIKHKKENYIWVESIGKIYIDKDGKKNFFTILRDINKEKMAEVGLQESEEHYRRINRELKYINKFINTGNKAKKIEDFFNEILTIITEFMELEKAVIYLYNKEKKQIILNSYKGLSEEIIPIVREIGVNNKYLQSLMESKRALFLDDYTIAYSELKRYNLSSVIAVPIYSEEQFLGVLSVADLSGREFSPDDLSIMLIIGDILGSVISRLQYEEKLKESEEKFRLLTEQSLMGILIAQENKIRYVNNAYADIIGYSTDEMYAWELEDAVKVIYPDDRDFAIAELMKKQSGRDDITINYQYRVIRRSGEVIWLETYSKPIIYENKPANLISVIDISDKKESEIKLKESEENYRLIFENANDLICITDPNVVILYVNQAYQRILGYSNDEIINKNGMDFIHPSDIEFATKSFQSGLEFGERTVEIRIKHKNGNYLWFNIYGRVYNDTRGNKRILLISRNVTEKKLAEEKLKESEEKFRTIAEQSLVAIAIVQDGVFKYVNEIGSKILGYSIDDLLNLKFEEYSKLIHPDDASYVMGQGRKKQDGDKLIPRNYSYRIINKLGEIKWIDQYSTPIKYEGKSASLAISLDITEKKKYEQQLKESEQKHRLIFENSPLGICYFDTNGVIATGNDMVCEMMGTTRENLIGFNALSNITNKDLLKALKASLNGDLGYFEGEYSSAIRNKLSYIKIDFAPMLSEDGIQLGSIAIIEDISERKKTELALEQERNKIKQYLDIAGVMLIILNRDQTVSLINKKGCEILGYSEEEIIGKNWFENFIPKNIKGEVKEVFERLMIGDIEPVKYFENFILTKEGKQRIIAWNNRYLRDETGNFTGTLSSGEDITEKKMAEKRLRESEENFRTIAEHSLIGFVIIQDISLKFVNETLAQILEYDTDELLMMSEKDFEEIIHPDDRKMRIENLNRTINSIRDQKFHDIFRIITKFGQIKWMENYETKINYDGRDAVLGTLFDITDRKKADEMIKNQNMELSILNKVIILGNESESLEDFLNKSFDFILENTEMENGGVYLYDPKTEYNSLIFHENIHPDFIEMLKNVDISEKPWKEVFNKNEVFIIDDFSKIIPNALERGIFSSIVLPLKAKDVYIGSLNFGTSIYRKFSQREIDFFIAVGKQMGLLIKKFQGEEKLIDSELMFRQITEQSLFGISILQDNKYIYMNAASEKIIGFKQEEVLKWAPQDFSCLIHPDDLNIVEEQAQKKQEGKLDVINHYLYRLFDKSGNLKWIDNYSKSIIYEGKHADLIIFNDVTQNKLAEQKLRESEEKYRLISENINELLIILNDKNEYEYINEDIHKKILGYSNVDLIGKKIYDFLNKEDLKNAKVKNITEETIKNDEFFLECRFKHAEGYELWLQFNINNFVDKEGANKAIILASDISERRALEEARRKYLDDLEKEVEYKTKELKNETIKLKETLNELETTQELLIQSEKLASIGLLASGIAHEINNPLMAIINFAKIVEDHLNEIIKIDINKKPFTFIKEIQKEGFRISEIVSGLLSFSREDKGFFDYTDIIEIIDSSLLLLRPNIKNSQIEIDLDFQEDIPNIPIRSQKIQQVIINILQNSIDALNEKKEKYDKKILIKTTLATLKKERYVKISITDNGIGISKQDLLKVFDPFYTTKTYSKEHGVGLGLSVSYGIMKAHKGDIRIKSKLNKETTVTLYLPVELKENMEKSE